jgi:alanine-glyoxylate transaminase / (R)-3-amino-2-methylpropionate-pyruvate transaminase
MTTAALPAMPATDHQPRPYHGPTKAEVLAMRKQYLHPSLFMLYRDPLMIVEGKGQFVWDETGKRYLDFFAGIVTVACGHCHPTIVERIKDQIDTLQHTTTVYLNPNLPRLAKKLAAKMPPGLEVTYFVNSGSEANDLAITMARLFTGNYDVIGVRNAYHGGSPAATGLTSHSTWKHPVPQSFGIHHTFCPDPYRSPFTGTPEEIASRSVAEMRDLIRYSTPGKIAAYIAEPIQGVGGATHGAPNYLGEAYQAARAAGGLCIADEVQTGFGRTGAHYWGFENWGVTPDIVTMAKGLGNGTAIAAVTTRAEIAKALTQRLHLNTFGGNPVAAVAAEAVLDVIDQEGLQENARVVGGKLKAGLDRLAEEHPLIGDVRGMGLMLGVELVDDRATRAPATGRTADVLEATKEMGLLVGKGGIDGNVLRIKPPLSITADDVEYALAVLHEALRQAS